MSVSQSEFEQGIEEQVDGVQAGTVGWDDLQVSIQQVGLGPVAPDYVPFKGGEVLAFQNTPGNPSINFVKQIPHGVKADTDLKPHIHFVLPTAGSGVGTENVKFDFTYSWAEIGAEFPAETTVSLTWDVQNADADSHSYAGFTTDVLNANKGTDGGSGVSSMLICSLTRDNTVADNYADDVYLLEFDFHAQMDQERGSRQEFAK